MPYRRSFFFGASLAIGASAFMACAASTEQPHGTGGSASTTSSTSEGGSSIGGSFSMSSAGGSGFGGGCVGTSIKANPVPLDIFLMLDQSGSMSQDAGNGMSRWQTIKAAMSTFVQDPASDGIGIGIQFFGVPDPAVHGCAQQTCTQDSDCMNGCTACMMPEGVCESTFNPDIDSCDPIDYAWADVPIQTLPGIGNQIVASIAAHVPGTNTPTSPALAGAIMYATKWATANPSHITIVALATDGEPSECDIDQTNIENIAAAGFMGMPSIKTYVVGVGPALSALDGVAAAGGTKSAFHVDLNAMATQEFTDAMNTIRGAEVGCTFQIPPPPNGMMEDFHKVNVRYTPGDGSPAQQFPKVADEAACPANGDGWYYDDEMMPTQIIFCDGTCAKVSKDTKAQVDIVLGCTTIVN